MTTQSMSLYDAGCSSSSRSAASAFHERSPMASCRLSTDSVRRAAVRESRRPAPCEHEEYDAADPRPVTT